MTRYGTIFSYWSKDWDTDWMQVLKNASKSDINCIEFHVHRTLGWTEKQIDEFVALAKELDIEILMNGGLGGDELTYSDDPAMRKKGVATIISYLKRAKRFGATFFDGGFSEDWPSRPKVQLTADIKQRYTDNVIAAMKEMVKVAEDLDITMSMEITNRFEAFLVNTTKEALYVAQNVDSPNLKVTVDTFHMNIEEDDIKEAIDTLGKKYIGHVHLGEANRKLPGRGSQIDWDAVFGSLKAIGYSERLLLEPFTKAFGTVGNNVFLWRDLTDGASDEQMIREMKESVAFVKSKFEV